MAATAPIQGRGILFVTSNIARPDVLDLPTYIKWYEEDHIAEIVQTSGIRSARRFVNADATVDKPYLAMYPMDDIGFTQGDEFRNIRVKSDILPPPGVIYDLADVDVRYDNLVHVYDESKKGKGVTKSLVVVASELKDGGDVSAEEYDKWYREEHCAMLAKHKSYLRTTRFKFVYARTNAQSRVLKGLAPPTNEVPPKPPTWLALHEFECEPEDLAVAELKALSSSPWGDKIRSSLDEHQVSLYRMANEFGEKDWFHGVDI